MRHAREYHAVATLSLQDVREHCLGLELDTIYCFIMFNVYLPMTHVGV